MTTRGQINSNFYQIVNVDSDGNPTSVKPQYIGNVANATHANVADVANSVAGANVTGTVGNATHATISDSANSVSVANVTGIGNIATINLDGNASNLLSGSGIWVPVPNTATANYANFAGVVVTNAQPNITSVGNLTLLNLDGNLNTPTAVYADGVVSPTPGSYVGVADSTFANGYFVDDINVSVSKNSNTWYFHANGAFGSPGNIYALGTFNGNAFGLTDLQYANIVGIGNISNINLNGNVTTLLAGDGTWVSAGTANNANYANFAGTAFSVSGSNVSGAVGLATYATTANSVAGANVSGTVANATYATTSGSATTAGTVTASSQPNITSVGTLIDLSVTGNIQGYANISGGYLFGNGAYLTGIGNLSAANGYWGSFYSNVTQTIASTTTAYVVTLNNSDPDSNGVYISSSSHINFQFSGTYNLQFSAQFDNSSVSSQDASVWLRKNGTDVVDSRGQVSVPSSHGGLNGQIIESWNYILKVNSGDYLELAWQAESTSVSMAYLGAGTTPTTPASPSIIVTAQQVTNVQPAVLAGSMSGNIIGNGFSLINIASISSVDGITGASFTGNGANLTNLTGSNVVGAVSGANHANIADSANSVSVANVSGIGNIATVNLDGNASNLLSGTGTWIPVPNTATANYANFAGQVVDATQSNITSLGNLVSLTVEGNAEIKQVLFVGNGAASTSFNNPTFIGKQTGSDFIQAALINRNGNGSADWVAYGDTSDDAQGWMDMGFTGSTFNDPNYSLTKANDGYIICQGMADGSGGNLIIATGGLGNPIHRDIVFATGGFSDTNEVMRVNHETNSLQISSNTVAANTTSGALEIVGGAGIGGNVYIGQNLSIAGTTNLGSVSNVHITGGTTGYVLSTDGAGNLSWTAGGSGTPAGSNTQVQYNNSGSFGASANFTFDSATNVLAASHLSGEAGNLSNIQGSNVSGAVGLATYATTANSVAGANVSGAVGLATYATTANSVAVGNVSGIGNIATINLTGSSSNILYGNGVFAAPATITTVANANSVLSNTATTATVYPLFTSNSANGYVSTLKSTGIIANLSGNTITATTFIGALSGTATNATNAGNASVAATANTSLGITTTLTTSGAGPFYPTFTSASSGNTAPLSDSGFTYNATVGTLTATGFAGNLTGNVFGVVTQSTQNTISRLGATSVTIGNTTSNAVFANGTVTITGNTTVGNIIATNIGNVAALNLTGSASNVLYGNGVFAAVTATNATNAAAVQSNTSTSVTAYPMFTTSSANGNVGTFKTTSISANLSNASITATTFVGALSGAATSATTAGTVTTNAQPNITSVGTLTTVDSSGNITGPNIVANTGAFYGAATGLTGIPGANISGQVSFAAVANSVAVANVSGIGNIATINLTGSTSNVLYGNGAFAAIGTVANSNFAAYAGNVTVAAQANITSLGSLSSLTVTGVTNLGAVANINITGGSSGYVLSTNGSGNLSWVAQSGGGGGATDFTPSFLLGGM